MPKRAVSEIQFEGKKYFSLAYASAHSEYHRDYLGQLIRKGSLPAKKIGFAWFIESNDFDAFLGSLKKSAVDLMRFEGREYLSLKTASKLAGYHKDYLGQLARKGELGIKKIGFSLFIEKNDFINFCKAKSIALAESFTEAPITQQTPSPIVTSMLAHEKVETKNIQIEKSLSAGIPATLPEAERIEPARVTLIEPTTVSPEESRQKKFSWWEKRKTKLLFFPLALLVLLFLSPLDLTKIADRALTYGSDLIRSYVLRTKYAVPQPASTPTSSDQDAAGRSAQLLDGLKKDIVAYLDENKAKEKDITRVHEKVTEIVDRQEVFTPVNLALVRQDILGNVDKINAQIREQFNSSLQDLKNQFNSSLAGLSDQDQRGYQGNFQAIAVSQRIDNLTGTRLTNITVNGVSGLTDADIPNDITITNGTFSTLTVSGAATSTFAGGINLTSGCFAINGTCITSGGGGGTPAGSTGAIQFNSGGSFGADVNNFFWDDTNKRFGVGTSSPSARLSVAGNAYFNSNVLTFASTSASSLILSYQHAATSTIPQVINAWSIATSTTAFPLLSFDGSSQGSVGFGTAHPGLIDGVDIQSQGFRILNVSNGDLSSLLNVEGASAGISMVSTGAPTSQKWSYFLNNNGITFLGINDDAGGTLYIPFAVTHSNGFIGIGGGNAPYSNLQVNGSSTAPQTFAVVSAASTTLLQVLNNGNVGIGTTSPVALFSVAGDSLYGTGSASTLTYNAGTFVHAVSATTTIPQSLNAWSIATSTSGIPILSINGSTGNVGIGTTTPIEELTIKSTAPGNDFIAGVASDNMTIFAVREDVFGDGVLSVRDSAGTARVSFSSYVLTASYINAGNFGVGTTSPSSLLSVHGTSYFSGTSFFGGTITGTSTLAIQSTTATSTFSTGGLTVGANQLVVQQTSGNVGIGTTSPATKLSVSGNILFDSNTITFASTSARTGLSFIYATSSTSTIPQTINAWSIGTSTGDVPMLSLDASGAGSLGIGTANPALVNSTTYPSNYRILNLSATTGLATLAWLNVESKAGSLFSLIDHDAFSSNIGYVTSIQNTNGRTVISATSSISSLTLNGTSGNVTVNSASPAFSRLQVNGSSAYPQTFAVVDSASSTILQVLDSGFVGIGTTSPAFRLSVHGSALLGTTTVAGLTATGSINILGTATSSFASGINISSGCFAIGNTCVGAGSGSGTVNTGTANALAYYPASNTTVDDAGSLFWDNTNGRLGVGTTTPGATLSLKGDALLDSNIITIGSSTATRLILAFATTSTTTVPANTFNAWSLATSTSAQDPLMSVDSRTGSIGFGTLTPAIFDGVDYTAIAGIRINHLLARGTAAIVADGTAAQLTLQDNDALSGSRTFTIQNSNASTAFYSTNGLTLVNNFFTLMHATGTIGVASSTPWGHFSIEKNLSGIPTFVVGDNGSTTPWFLISDNGRVGVGTTTPGSNLSLVGNALFDSNVITYGSTSAKTGLTFVVSTSSTTTIPSIGNAWAMADTSGNPLLVVKPYSLLGTGVLAIGTSSVSIAGGAAFGQIHAVGIQGGLAVSSAGNPNLPLLTTSIALNPYISGTCVSFGACYTTQISPTLGATDNSGAVISALSIAPYQYTGTTTTFYGLNVADVSYQGGRLTTQYGVRIAAQTTGSTTWNLYSEGASSQNYFAGKVGIGTTTPGAILSVSGNTLLDSNVITYASTSARSGLTFVYSTSSTSTVPALINSWSIGTTTAAGNSPLFSLDGLNGRASFGTSTTANAVLTINPGPQASISWGEGLGIEPASSGFNAVFFHNATGSVAGTWSVGRESNSNFAVLRNGMSNMVGTDRVDNPFLINWTTGISSFGGALGIGTSTPAGMLQVSSSTAPQLVLSDTGASANAKHWYASSSAGALAFGSMTDAFVSTERTRIDSNGNFLVGTTTTGGLTNTIRGIFDNNNPANTVTSVRVGNRASSTAIALVAGRVIYPDASRVGIEYTTTSDFAIGPNLDAFSICYVGHGCFESGGQYTNPPLLIKKTSFNLGISTSSPAERLSVSGNALISGTTTIEGNLVFSKDTGSVVFPPAGASNNPMVYMFSSGTSNSDRMVLAHSPAFPTWGLQYIDSSDKFSFLAGGTDVLTVDLGSKRVGINDSAPGAVFDVSGSVTLDANVLTLASTSAKKIGLTVVYATTSTSTIISRINAWAMGTTTAAGNAPILSVDGLNGKVGIGTSTPWATLSINASATSSPLFTVGSSTQTQFVITNTGIVGIGTSSPSATYLLDISKDQSFTGARISTKATVGTAALVVESDTAQGYFAAYGSGSGAGLSGNIGLFNSNGGLFIETDTSAPIIFNLGGFGVEKMRILPTGAVGIGTTTPWGLLSVEQSSGTSTPVFVVGDSGTSTPHFIVSANGDVGVGSSTPTATLSVLGRTPASVTGTGLAADFGLYVQAGNGGASSVASAGGAGGGIYLAAGNGGLGTAFPATGGTGGNVTLLAGSPVTGGWYGGTPGSVFIAAGSQPTSISTNGATPSANPGGIIDIRAGTGTVATSCCPGDQLGSSGGALSLTGGAGGSTVSVSGASAIPNGGDVILNGGTAGTRTGTNTGTGNAGNVLLASIQGFVGVGTTSPWGLLSVEQTASASTTLANPVFVVSDAGTSTPHFLIDQRGWIGAGTTTPWGQVSIEQSGAATPVFVIGDQGTATPTLFVSGRKFIGVGTTTPGAAIDIANGALCVDDATPTCGDSARTAGTIYAVSTSITGIDVAENYPTSDTSLAAGDLVAFDSTQSVYVVKANGAASSTATVVGVVSTAPGVELGGFGIERYPDAKKVPIALSGRVPVKVSLGNGPIVRGDRISASSLPGYGVKARLGDATVGIALESFDGIISNGSSSSSTGTGTILVFINLSENRLAVGDEPVVQEIQQKISSLEDRVAALEQIVGLGSTTPSTPQPTSFVGDMTASIVSALRSFGVELANGILAVQKVVAQTLFVDHAIVKNLEADTLKASAAEFGSSSAPTGLTMYDRATHQPYCMSIENGDVVKTAGACAPDGVQPTAPDPSAPPPSAPPAPDLPPPTPEASPTPPVSDGSAPPPTDTSISTSSPDVPPPALMDTTSGNETPSI